MSSGKRYTFDSIAYPRYYFIQTRLQDLLPRWKRILDTGRLPDCILDGTSTLQDIISDSQYCKHYTNVYLFADDHFLQEDAADLKLSVEVDKSLLGDMEVDKSLLGDMEVDKSLLGDVEVDKSLLGDMEVDKSLLGDVEVEKSLLGDVEVDKSLLGDVEVDKSLLGDVEVGKSLLYHFLHEDAVYLELSGEFDKSLLGDVEVDKSLLGDVEVDKSLLGDVEVDKSLLGDVEVDKSLLGDVEVEKSLLGDVEVEKSLLGDVEVDKSLLGDVEVDKSLLGDMEVDKSLLGDVEVEKSLLGDVEVDKSLLGDVEVDKSLLGDVEVDKSLLGDVEVDKSLLGDVEVEKSLLGDVEVEKSLLGDVEVDKSLLGDVEVDKSLLGDVEVDKSLLGDVEVEKSLLGDVEVEKSLLGDVEVDKSLLGDVEVDKSLLGDMEVDKSLLGDVEVDKSLLGDVEVDKSLLGDVEVDKSLLGDVEVDKSLLGDVEVDKSLLGDMKVENVSWKEFKDGLKNFHVCQPTAVVMVQPNFDKSNVELLSGLTKEQQDDVIIYNSNSKTSLLYSDLVKVDFNLDNINLSDDRSSFLHGCLSAQIQNIFERKVVSVLASIAQYNRPLVPNPPQEPEKSLYESLYYDVHESLTNQTVITDLFPRPEGKTKTADEKNAIFQDNLVDFVARKSKCISCDKLSITFGIKPQFVNEFLNKGFFNFDGKIRKKVWSLHLPRYEERGSPSLMLKELESLMFRLGTIFQTIIEEAEKFLLNIMQVLEKLFQLQFELFGMLCLVKVEINVDIPPLRMIQTDLQNDLLHIDGVLGCGTLYGMLTLHVEKLLTKQQKKEISEVLELYGHREGYKCQVLKSREEQAGGHLIESGQTLRARCLMAVKDPHLYGSLGCFVEMIPRDPNVVEKSKSSEPGAKVSTAFMIKENEVHAITCAHCVKGCDSSIDVKTGENFVHFGTKKCEEYFNEVLDVATIAVDPTRQMSCDSKLKRFDAKSFTNQWQYYDGNPCRRQVHKEGSATKFTKGIVISADYASQKFKQYNSYRLSQNILIEPLPDLPEGQSVLAGPIELGDEQFSMKGDSGSVICTDNAEDYSVYIVSLLIGAALSSEGKYCYSYSSDFKKTMLELMERYDVEIRPALLNGRTPAGASTS